MRVFLISVSHAACVSRDNEAAAAATAEIDTSHEMDAAMMAAVLVVGSFESLRLVNGRRAAGLDSFLH